MEPPKGFLNLFSSVQQSLIGKITPNLRELHLIFKDETSYVLIFYYHDSISEDEKKLAAQAYGYVASDFPPPIFTSSYSIRIVPSPNKIGCEGHCLYRRFEE